jgi:hypothetical protein
MFLSISKEGLSSTGANRLYKIWLRYWTGTIAASLMMIFLSIPFVTYLMVYRHSIIAPPGTDLLVWTQIEYCTK